MSRKPRIAGALAGAAADGPSVPAWRCPAPSQAPVARTLNRDRLPVAVRPGARVNLAGQPALRPVSRVARIPRAPACRSRLARRAGPAADAALRGDGMRAGAGAGDGRTGSG